MRSRLLSLTAIWVITCGCSFAAADDPYVDPYTISAASNGWQLRVEPSSPQGEGCAKYRMLRDGAVAWEAELGYTLRECVVSSSGVVVGYAYDNGYMGWGGKLIVLVIASDGKVITTDEWERDGPNLAITPEPPGDPRGVDVLIDEAGARAIVEMTTSDNGDKPYLWTIYSLVDGHQIGQQRPVGPSKGKYAFSRRIRAITISGAGLVAVHWMAWENSRESAVFELIDRDGKVVWARRIDGEYAQFGEHWNWWELVRDGVRQLEAGPSGFSIVSYSTKSRTNYTVARASDGTWAVEETAVSPDTPPRYPKAPTTLATRSGSLQNLNEVKLDAPGSVGVLRGFDKFSFNERGQLGWMRSDRATGKQNFTLINRDGGVVVDHELQLPKATSTASPMVIWLSGNRWVVARTNYSEGSGRAEAWFLDAVDGTLARVPELAGGSIERICRTPDGGFFLLASLHGEHTIRDQIMRYSSDGQLITSKTEPGYGQGDMFQDIAVLSDGTLVALVAVPDVVKLWRTGEGEPEVWPLKQKLVGTKSGEHGYYPSIRADKDKGLVVYDSANNNLLHRLDREGKPWQSLHARGPKDEPFRLYDRWGVDPDGRIWVSDGARLFRCDETGRADVALGGPPPGSMTDPVALTMDSKGWIYALEAGTGAAHVFDETGKPVRVMKPEPTDTPTQDALAWIVVDGNGGVRYRMSWEGPIVSFDAGGNRIGSEIPPESWETNEATWHDLGNGWQHDGSTLHRLDDNGVVIKTLRHRPDGAWLVSIDDTAVCSDGSFAVLCDRPSPGWGISFENRPKWLCVYDSDGVGRTTIGFMQSSLFHRLEYCGHRLWMLDETGVTSFEAPMDQSPVAWRYELPGPEGTFWHLMPRPDGSLAGWAHGTRSVQFWRMSSED